MTHVWVLTSTEYAGQCTGFSSQTDLLCLFSQKPTMLTLAPYLTQGLSEDMGTAIAQVQTLLDTGVLRINDYFDYELVEKPFDTKLA